MNIVVDCEYSFCQSKKTFSGFRVQKKAYRESDKPFVLFMFFDIYTGVSAHELNNRECHQQNLLFVKIRVILLFN